MTFRRSSHAVFECQYHVVWSTKYRKKVLTLPHEREFCEQIIRRAADEYGMQIEAIEVDEDHVHVYINIPPQRSVGRAVGILKSVSARAVFRRFQYMKRKLWAGELWGVALHAQRLRSMRSRWQSGNSVEKVFQFLTCLMRWTQHLHYDLRIELGGDWVNKLVNERQTTRRDPPAFALRSEALRTADWRD